MKSEQGFSLIEVSISVMLLAVIGLAFLSALATSATATSIMDERTTAKNLACSQMDHLKSQAYAGEYEAATIPGADYVASIITDTDGDIQKITVSIAHNGQVVTTLEAYKVAR